MTDRAVIQRPHKFIPHSNPYFAENAVWIEMTPIKIVNQFTTSFGGRISTAREKQPTFRFLAPKDLPEVLAHTWSPYESIQSRIAGKVKSFAKLSADLGALKNTIKKGGKGLGDLISSEGTLLIAPERAGQTISRLTAIAVGAVGATVIPKVKVDTPLYYEDSERRRFTFTIEIVAEDNPKVDVVDPIKKLMEYSAPEIRGALVRIDFPFIFHVRTSPKDFINMKTVAMVGIQPTWGDPYIGGYPSRVSCQFDFLDLSPLYRKTLKEGGVINVKPIKSSENKGTDNVPQIDWNKKIRDKAKKYPDNLSDRERRRIEGQQGLGNQSENERRRIARRGEIATAPPADPTIPVFGDGGA